MQVNVDGANADGTNGLKHNTVLHVLSCSRNYNSITPLYKIDTCMTTKNATIFRGFCAFVARLDDAALSQQKDGDDRAEGET